MQAGAAALALPAGAAVALLLARGGAVLEGSNRASFVVLAASGLAGVAAVLVAAVRGGRSSARLPRATRALIEAVSGALGDAVLVLEGGGRVVRANDAAGLLVGMPAARILGREASFLGPDLAALRRGLDRGPAAAFITVIAAAGPVRARATLVRVSRRPAVDVAVLRPEPPALRTGRPGEGEASRAAAAAAPGREHDLALAAIAAALRDPLVRASTAASMLRLVLAAPPLAAERELLRLEEELAVAERRLAALAAAGERGRHAPRRLDLAGAAAELARTISLPDGVSIRAFTEPAFALADEGRLRPALREAIRGAAAALPHGGELRLRTARRGGEVVLEIAAAGLAGARRAWLPFVRALVGPTGARVEEDATAGGETVCRVVLPAAEEQPTVDGKLG